MCTAQQGMEQSETLSHVTRTARAALSSPKAILPSATSRVQMQLPALDLLLSSILIHGSTAPPTWLGSGGCLSWVPCSHSIGGNISQLGGKAQGPVKATQVVKSRVPVVRGARRQAGKAGRKPGRASRGRQLETPI